MTNNQRRTSPQNDEQQYYQLCLPYCVVDTFSRGMVSSKNIENKIRPSKKGARPKHKETIYQVAFPSSFLGGEPSHPLSVASNFDLSASVPDRRTDSEETSKPYNDVDKANVWQMFLSLVFGIPETGSASHPHTVIVAGGEGGKAKNAR